MGVPIVQPCEVALATGGFHSLAEIGEGGFGKVYRCGASAALLARGIGQAQDRWQSAHAASVASVSHSNQHWSQH